MDKLIGNKKNKASERQVNDYYATSPEAFDILNNNIEINKNIWECATGENYLANRMIDLGYNVKKSDIHDYGDNEIIDFLNYYPEIDGHFEGDIITNPPYKHAKDFAIKGLECLQPKNKLMLFLKIQFLESKSRYNFLKENPPKYILACSNRVVTAKDGDFSKIKSTALFLAWFIWEKGYRGETTLKVVNGN